MIGSFAAGQILLTIYLFRCTPVHSLGEIKSCPLQENITGVQRSPIVSLFTFRHIRFHATQHKAVCHLSEDNDHKWQSSTICSSCQQTNYHQKDVHPISVGKLCINKKIKLKLCLTVQIFVKVQQTYRTCFVSTHIV